MTSRERSILIGTASVVLALLAVVLGVRAMSRSADVASQADGQFIENSGTDSAVGSASTSVLAPSARTRSGAVDAPSLSLLDTESPVPSLPAAASTSVPASATTTVGKTSVAPSTAPPTSRSTSSSQMPAPSTSAATIAPSTSPPSTQPSTTTSSSNAPSTEPPTTVTTQPPGGLNAVELEILRLTNALRADPSGPLARIKPMPSCVNETFYGIAIGGSGHPAPAPALSLSEPVSIQLARAWSIEMDRTGNFGHRSNDSASAIYASLGINWSATGENIAWFRGYPDSQAAQIFFEGWRESDSGHYCAMVAPTYSHIGVGYHKGSTSSWATQNFYRPR